MKNLLPTLIIFLLLGMCSEQACAIDGLYPVESKHILTRLDSIRFEKEDNKQGKTKEVVNTTTQSRFREIDFSTSSSSSFSLQEDVLFADRAISVNKVYPNPASDIAFVDYNMIESIRAKIVIRNLLGKVIAEYDLARGANKLRIPTNHYDSGLYFYTLIIGGKARASRKLFVKRN